MRLLLVDDEELSRRAIRITLAREMPQIEVVGEASDGVEAVERVEELRPDLVLMDIKMPEQNGLQATDALRKKGDPVRIVFLSAYDEFEYARLAIELHADAYLLKPVETAELVRALGECERRIRAETDPGRARFSALPRGVSKPSWRLRRALEYVDLNLSRNLFLEDVAREVGVGAQHLCRLFRTELDDSFTRYVNQRRIDHACHLLSSSALNVSEVADRVGFRDANYFGKVFRRMIGSTPSDFRRSVAG
ncbi:MAG: response regulator [Spirochaetales bacterium]